MPKFLRILLQLVGLVKKYEPVVEDVAKAVAPVVKAAAEDAKKAAK
jgi:hypothetical protein